MTLEEEMLIAQVLKAGKRQERRARKRRDIPRAVEGRRPAARYFRMRLAIGSELL